LNKKLSIGIIGTRGIPNQYGGYEAAVQELAPRLVEMGHQVVVYCSSLQKTNPVSWKGVKLVYSLDPENKLGSFGQFIYDMISNIKSKKNNHDVIFHMGYTSDSLWVRLWDKRATHITNMDGMEWMRSKYSPKVRSFLKKAEQWAAVHSKTLIADSHGIKDYLEENYDTPVAHITYGVTIPEEFNVSVLKEFNLIPYKYDLIVARIVPENNIEMIISAKINSDDEIPLIIYGNKNEMLHNLKIKFVLWMLTMIETPWIPYDTFPDIMFMVIPLEVQIRPYWRQWLQKVEFWLMIMSLIGEFYCKEVGILVPQMNWFNCLTQIMSNS